jgi:hypothetical protein
LYCRTGKHYFKRWKDVNLLSKTRNPQAIPKPDLDVRQWNFADEKK